MLSLNVGAIRQRRMPLPDWYLFGEGSLRRPLTEFQEHYHAERNHQGKGNVLLFPSTDAPHPGPAVVVRRKSQLGGLLNYYCRAA